MATANQYLPKSTRKALIQTAFLGLVIIIIWGAVSSARTNLSELGISSGFAFLDRATGWGYSFSLFERSIDDTYARTLFIGFTNTLFLGILSIILATILGVIMGTLRDARNIAAKSLATLFVQVFRNIPLILQLVFWYAVLIHMPGPRQSYSLFDTIFLSNRGIMVPWLNMQPEAGMVLSLFAIALAFILFRWSGSGPLQKTGLWLIGTVVAAVLLASLSKPEGEPALSIPALEGLRFQGGLTISIEFVAMVIAIVLYGASYIAEVVRGGLQEVPKGLVEAGQSLGLSPGAVWTRIRMPMALRTIIPPLGNQWIFLMKATTIGVAIGFSDLFMIVSTSITQSGQTLELIGILMASFLLINFTLALLVNALNARLQLKGH
ncbi:MAG: ABC transporter permease subunit [Pseudomonadota bacterium]